MYVHVTCLISWCLNYLMVAFFIYSNYQPLNVYLSMFKRLNKLCFLISSTLLEWACWFIFVLLFLSCLWSIWCETWQKNEQTWFWKLCQAVSVLSFSTFSLKHLRTERKLFGLHYNTYSETFTVNFLFKDIHISIWLYKDENWYLSWCKN